MKVALSEITAVIIIEILSTMQEIHFSSFFVPVFSINVFSVQLKSLLYPF